MRPEPHARLPFDTSFGRRLEHVAATCAAWIGALRGWRQALAALLAGAVSILAMAPFHLWPVLLVTLPVLVWLLDGARAMGGVPLSFGRWRVRGDVGRAAVVGWCFGVGYHVPGLYWLREAFAVTAGTLELLWPLAVIGLPAFLGLFTAAAVALTVTVPWHTNERLLALACALSGAEWLRGHVLTGFPWNVLGYALTYPLVLMQSASVIGIYGLTLLMVPMLAGPAVRLAAGRQPGDRVAPWVGACLVIGIPLFFMVTFGVWRLSAPPPPMVAGVQLRLVQPNIAQRDKWLFERQRAIFQRHLQQSRQGPDGRQDDLAGISHVVWPEAAMPFQPLGTPEALAAIGDLLPPGTHLLAGLMRSERVGGSGENIRTFNSLTAFSDDGKPAAIYDKIHLVPYGEYLPFAALLEAVGLQTLTRQRGGFAVGTSPRQLLRIAGLPPVGVLICYEAIFPADVVQAPDRPGFFLNITNDGWFGDSTGPRQHLHQARLRAVEEGIPLLRVANNGISAVFDPYGRELARLGLDRAGVIDTGLPGVIAAPLYARLGDGLFLLALSLLSGILMWQLRQRDASRPTIQPLR